MKLMVIKNSNEYKRRLFFLSISKTPMNTFFEYHITTPTIHFWVVQLLYMITVIIRSQFSLHATEQ